MRATLASCPRVALHPYAKRATLALTPAQWREIDRETGERIVARILWRGLAYKTSNVERAEADSIARAFVSFVARDSNVRCFTNGSLGMSDSGGSSWNPATTATFDTGVVIVADGRIGHAWVEDED